MMPRKVGPNSDEMLAERVRSELRTIMAEYADLVEGGVIQHEMEVSLSEFREARVKDFVPLLAGRHTRLRLSRYVPS